MKIVNGDIESFSKILLSAIQWMNENGESLWYEYQVSKERLVQSYSASDIYVGSINEVTQPIVGSVVQDHDPFFWPDVPKGESLFVHKLAVRSEFRSQGYAEQFLDWVQSCGRSEGKGFLRLDCDANRSSLCHFYERYGFIQVDRRMVGPFDTALFEMPIC